MGKSILIVDDNAVNLKLAADILELDGHDVVTASDAVHALEILQNIRPELILMDIALPGMDGLTLTRHLKNDESFKHIPVIALTAFAMRGDDRKALDAGCIGYITKPIDTRQFTHQINNYLQGTCEEQGNDN